MFNFQNHQNKKTPFVIFTTFNLMQGTINYFNSWCNNFNNFNDTAFSPYFAIVWTCRYADACLPISSTGAIIIILATNIIELVQLTLLLYYMNL